MKQLVQNLKTGEMNILEVPVPALSRKGVLVRVHHSLISAGTEGSKVSTARKSYIGKAKEKPDQVKQVLGTLKNEGIANTYRKVMNKLDAWVALGYNCAGEVIETGDNVNGFKPGDLVACGSEHAAHAQIVAVPVNLCAKIPQGVSTEHAAFTTLGAIAMQGVRQADLHLGESCAVIGLGLLGQLTLQILNAFAVQTFGIDIDEQMAVIARKNENANVYLRADASLVQSVIEKSGGYGVDAVIVTAGTNSLDPVELAGQLARKKGKVVIVGAVPTGFSRENYYKKELDLRMSCSYGPGRYDPQYEEHGIDYPYGYVRWTENRNMQAFLNLIAQNKVSTANLTTHVFDFEKAPAAYELITKRTEPFLGIVLKYNQEEKIKKTVYLHDVQSLSNINVGFIGAGSFAQTYLLPNVKSFANTSFIGVATGTGNSARTIAEKYRFQFATSDFKQITDNNDINTVFIATRHNLHAQQVISALKQGKNVFVEKPLALTIDELKEIKRIYQDVQNSSLMVGFNRRFAPLVQKMKSHFTEKPVSILYRINAGFIPKDHWIQDVKVGGGRIIGEVCHFVDLAGYFAASKPISVSAAAMETTSDLNDTLIINLAYENGSIAQVAYFSNGSKSLAKEYIEIYGHGVTAILNDFSELNIYGKKKKTIKTICKDKGHKKEVKLFLESIKNGEPSPVPFEELLISSLLPFKIIESLKSGKTIKL